MSFATDHPTIIDGHEYLPFKQWDITYNDVRTVHDTEAGTQEDVIINLGRRTIAVSTTCLQPVARLLACLEDKDNFEIEFYDIKTDADITTTVRVVPGSMMVSLLEKTANLSTTKGVYTVSFTMEEYE